MPKIKNIIIFLVIFGALIALYFFFFKKSPDEASLISSAPTTATPGATDVEGTSLGQDFLSILLNIKNITLNDSIFSDPAFLSLVDSSILLIPDTDPGRPNPFAPIGNDLGASPMFSGTSDVSSTTTTPTTPSTPN